MTAPSIRLENIKFSYPGVEVFKDISFHFQEGAIYTIMGPSGSGKSTLLKLIIGLKEPLSGRIIRGDETTKESYEIGVMPQSLSVYSELSVWENLLLGYALSKGGFPEDKFNANLKEIVQVLEIDTYLGGNVATLSRGEKQRIALARCLAYEPSVLVLDEPNSSLDYKTSENVRSLLEEYRCGKDLLTIIFTHDRRFAEMSDEVLTISDYSLVL